MEYNNLLELIKTVAALNISGFQYEEGSTKIIITTGGNGLPGAMSTANGPATGSLPVSGAVCGVATEGLQAGTTVTTGVVSAQSSAVAAAVQNSVTAQEQTITETGAATQNARTGNIVKSPLVGTFYAAPAEDAEPFVKVGDVVKKGQTLAIVEAMKLMNDIEAEYDGTILEIFVENGAAVEYGQPLFSIG